MGINLHNLEEVKFLWVIYRSYEVITSENGFNRKPAPDSFIHLKSKYHFRGEEGISVGDRILDIEASKKIVRSWID